jgi:hypothetical protein
MSSHQRSERCVMRLLGLVGGPANRSRTWDGGVNESDSVGD